MTITEDLSEHAAILIAPFGVSGQLRSLIDRLGAGGVVTTIVDDPRYLYEPFTTSTHLKKDPRPAEWHPEPCLRGKPGLKK